MATQIIVSDVGEIAPGSALSEEIAHSWLEVANTGGAVGFPFIPVDIADVRAAVIALCNEIEAGHRRVIAAHIDNTLVGWVSIAFNRSPLTAHWAKIQHLQSHPTQRGQGIGNSAASRRYRLRDIGRA